MLVECWIQTINYSPSTACYADILLRQRQENVYALGDTGMVLFQNGCKR